MARREFPVQDEDSKKPVEKAVEEKKDARSFRVECVGDEDGKDGGYIVRVEWKMTAAEKKKMENSKGGIEAFSEDSEKNTRVFESEEATLDYIRTLL